MNWVTRGAASADLLLVDDNEPFREALARSLVRHGWKVTAASTGDEALASARRHLPARVVLDLNLDGVFGLDLIPRLLEIDAAMRIVVLTGYASIATAVEAIRRGATHYLAKPVEVGEIVAAFERTSGDSGTPLPLSPLPLNQLEWEHLQRTLFEHAGNISATARVLGLHRRSLQRKLRKHACW
jgi:two-component system, response regulator RegA